MKNNLFNILIKENIDNFKLSNVKIEKIINNIRFKIKNYVIDNNLKSLVIGISGGLDSAIVAALCQEKYTGVPLIGLSIPIDSSNIHRKQADLIGKKYCNSFQEFNGWDINEFNNQIYQKLKQTDKIAIENDFNIEHSLENILLGNMKARLRMITLYDLARKTNGIVLSTDNYSEYLMGFWTICGDVGDYAPIQKLFKGLELPQIAKFLNIDKNIIKQKPSDGLGVTNEDTDEAQLGANYIEVDTIMSIYLKEKDFFIKNINNFSEIEYKKINKIINRYKNTHFKRNGTIILERNDIIN